MKRLFFIWNRQKIPYADELRDREVERGRRMTNKHKLEIKIGIGIGLLAVFAVYFCCSFKKES